MLADVATLTINTAAGGGGNVTISGKLDSKTSGRDVDIVTGSGLTTIGGNIGTTLALSTLDINAAVNAANTGGVTLSGDVGVGVVSGTTPGVTGALALGNANTTGVITLSGEDFNTGGAITFTGGSYTVANGSTDLTIVTSNDAVDFNSGTVTVGNLSLIHI